MKHSLNWIRYIVCFTGDVQIGMMDKKGQLEVEVIRARGLNPKPGSRSLPGTTHTDTQTHECAHPPTHTQTDKCVCSPYPYSFLPPTSLSLQLPMSRCTCWITAPVKPKRKPRLHVKPWSHSTSRPCCLKRAHRGRSSR